MLLSILIPTLHARRDLFEQVYGKLQAQIRAAGLGDAVEVLALRDGGETPTGTKRNRLVQAACGQFVVHVDDDDDVHERYVPLIVEALRRYPSVDCLGIRGEIVFAEGTTRPFFYSARFEGYQRQGGVYQRPPHHLNPMRRDLALRYPFEDVYRNEDADCALRMSRDGVLQREHVIETVLYFYRTRRYYAYQWLLDVTEWVRHPLGLVFTNWVRLRRWLRRCLSSY